MPADNSSKLLVQTLHRKLIGYDPIDYWPTDFPKFNSLAEAPVPAIALGLKSPLGVRRACRVDRASSALVAETIGGIFY